MFFSVCNAKFSIYIVSVYSFFVAISKCEYIEYVWYVLYIYIHIN